MYDTSSYKFYVPYIIVSCNKNEAFFSFCRGVNVVQRYHNLYLFHPFIQLFFSMSDIEWCMSDVKRFHVAVPKSHYCSYFLPLRCLNRSTLCFKHLLFIHILLFSIQLLAALVAFTLSLDRLRFTTDSKYKKKIILFAKRN